SMFMSNTATTAMMLAILMTILSVFDPADKGRIAFALGIPLAANIGGIGTPIGTPPNAIALKYFTGTDVISFGSWMVFGVPFVLVMLFISWVLLLWLFPISIKSLTLDFRKGNIKSPQSRTVLITFFLTILLWLTDFLHGMNSYIVATIPVAVFLSAGIITREDLKKLSWDVLWLVSGGIALGYALDKSNLASNLISAIPFDTFPLLVLIVGAAFLAALMANFMSNTAAANLLLPLIAVIGTTLPGVEAIGGSKTMILSVALACSMGMVLPISTPPNALAHATGLFSTKEMARVGTIVGFIGLIVIFILMYLMNMIENL
ncbi:MAG: SLC13 family permease, partial [Cyclobacteriaceae bacterium]|nr:SLC13 family permease [Cyclobacteriaceae bacterium]